jgi:tetratricopeptide (TPR) repeat protein
VAACWGLTLLALLAYSNSFDGGFVLDNQPIIVDNPRLREPVDKAVRQIARTEYWWPYAGVGLYRPLTIFSYWCNYRLLGNADRPFGYHVVNFLLHAGIVLLVYALVLTLTGRFIGALVAGALFAVHPIATEAVTNIVGRADLLAALGVVGGLLAHIRSQSAHGGRRGAWLATVAVAYGLGLFSKENAIVLPAVALVHDLAFRKRSWPSYAAMAPVLVVWFFMRHDVLSHNPAFVLTSADYIDNSLLKGDAWTARVTAVKIIGKYFGLLLWPATLSADYSYNQIPLARLADPGVLAAVVAIVAVLALAAWQWRQRPVVSFFLLMFFLALAPVSNLFFLTGTTMAERFLYLPAVALAGVIGSLTAELFERAPWPTGVCAGALVVACGIRTYVRNEDWRDDLGFWVKLVNTSPNSYRGHAGLAAAVINHDPDHQYVDAAVASVQRALAIAPDAVPVQITAGQVYRAKGDTLTSRDILGEMRQTPASLHWYQESLAALQNAAAHLTVSPVAQNTGQPNAALSVNESRVYDELGQTWMRLGNPTAAVEAFRRARRANPTREAVFLRLGDALVAAGQPEEAARSYWQALFIATDRVPAQKALAAIYAKDCPQMNVTCPRIHDDICAAHIEMIQLLDNAGQKESAAEVRQHAIADYGCRP